MSVAIPIPLLQHLPDVNVTPAVGVDEYALTYDHGTASFVLRAPAAPFAGILATGATVGATAQAQAFTLGVVSPFIAPAADSTTAWQVRKADGTTPIVTVDTTNGYVGIGTSAPAAKLHLYDENEGTGNVEILRLQTNYNANGAQRALTWYDGNNITGQIDTRFNGTTIDMFFGHFYSSGYKTSDLVTIKGNGLVGINDTAPAEALDVTGNINTTGVYKVDDVQVLSNRVIDARCADVANSGDATTDGLIDALRDAMIAHGLIAASA